MDLEIRNRLSVPIVLVAKTGNISRRIVLEPHDRFTGWMVNPGGGAVDIEIAPK